MRTRQVSFFDYGYGDSEPQPLYWKSQLIDDPFPDYSTQCSFNNRLTELELPTMEGYGLSPDDFEAISKNGYELQIKGYRFYQV